MWLSVGVVVGVSTLALDDAMPVCFVSRFCGSGLSKQDPPDHGIAAVFYQSRLQFALKVKSF